MEYESKEKFDYIFISSGSVSLFTDIDVCKKILWKMKELLKPGGKFVFAVDSIKDRCEDDEEYKTSIEVKTKEGFDLVLKGKNRFDEETNTQYSPSVYELYRGSELLQKEEMDFQTHLYELGELEPYLEEIRIFQGDRCIVLMRKKLHRIMKQICFYMNVHYNWRKKVRNV